MTRVFSSRKGQALEALENALERCECEGIIVHRERKDSDVFQEWHSDDDVYDESICIWIPKTRWDGDSILLVGEEFPKV